MTKEFISIRNVNVLSPYQITVADESGKILRFTTDNALIYEVSFFKDDSLYVDGVFQFVIEEMSNSHSSHDPKIEQAIVAILNLFFEESDRVLAFVCDTKDNHAPARNILFNHWFHKYGGTQLTKMDGVIKAEGEEYYSSLITRTDNPNFSILRANYTCYIEQLQK